MGETFSDDDLQRIGHGGEHQNPIERDLARDLLDARAEITRLREELLGREAAAQEYRQDLTSDLMDVRASLREAVEEVAQLQVRNQGLLEALDRALEAKAALAEKLKP